jgi:hypothetical protein
MKGYWLILGTEVADQVPRCFSSGGWRIDVYRGR